MKGHMRSTAEAMQRDQEGCTFVIHRIENLSRSLGLLLVLGLALSSCGNQTIVRTVTANGGSPSRTSQGSTGSGSAQRASLGDTLTLKGDNGEEMAVTVDRVMDPLPVGQLDQADSGQRFVGVQITLKNVGSVPYSDSPSNGATLLSNTDEQAKSQQVSGGPCSNDFGSSATIAPGSTQQGCLAFEMPSNQSTGTFQFTLSSGFADQPGEWSLPATPTDGSTGSGSASATGPAGGLSNHCSPGVDATESVSCELASNVFYEYFEATQGGGSGGNLSAWSPALNQYYKVSCSQDGDIVKCLISGTSDPNAEVDLAQSALAAYSPQQASSYSASHDVGPNG